MNEAGLPQIAAYLLSGLPFYLLGTFPTGYLISKSQGVDIASQGSGNVGATNVARSVGKKAGIATLLGDILKGFLAPLLGYYLSGNLSFACLCGVLAIAGHCISIPGYLKGGKGVATSLGAFLYISPLAAGFGLLVFAVMMFGFKIVSLASIAAVLLVPVFALLTDSPSAVSLSLGCIALLVTLRHKENIIRLIRGEEKKFKSASKKG